jgi:hypothetical protein
MLFANLLVASTLSYGTSLTPLPRDGSLLLRQCQTTIKVMDAGRNASVEDTISAQFCGDYIEGYADALVAAKEICVSNDISNGAMVRAYSSFMQLHPEFLKQYQAVGVRAALKSKYSCGKRVSGH